MNPKVELAKALAVTAELTGTELSAAAARVMADDLSTYPHEQVMRSLVRCRRELRGRLTIAAVIERLDDGRPGANEAWAMIPKDEAGSVVWTAEMATAYGRSALPLLREGATIAARSAFIETYERLVMLARERGEQPTWTPSLGHDPNHREAALRAAVERGHLRIEHAQQLMPQLEMLPCAVDIASRLTFKPSGRLQ